ARPRDRRSLGEEDRPLRRRPRSDANERLRRRARLARAGALLLPARSAGRARHRLGHAVPARARVGVLPRPRARRCGAEAHDGTVAVAVHVIRVPDLGEGIAEVELVAWHVQPGESIAEDQGLADVMTDKASVEIPSPVAGKVLALGGEVGQMLAVGSDLIRIELDDGTATTTAAPAPVAADAPEAIAASANKREGAAATTAAPPPPPPPTPSPARSSASSRPLASPAVRALAWELGVDLAGVAATGTAGRITRSDVET